MSRHCFKLITADQFVKIFNQVSRIVSFESDPNAVTSMVYNLQNNHINKRDIIAINSIKKLNENLSPEIITAKYQITITDNNETPIRLLLFLAKEGTIKNPYLLYDYPVAFKGDQITSYMFIPEEFISVNSTPNKRWMSTFQIFRKIIHLVNETSITKDDEIIAIAAVCASIIVPNGNSNEYSIPKELQNLYEHMEANISLGTYGAPELMLSQNHTDGQYTIDDLKFDIEQFMIKINTD